MGFVWWRSAAVLLAVALVCGYSSPLQFHEEWGDSGGNGMSENRVKREPKYDGNYGYNFGGLAYRRESERVKRGEDDRWKLDEPEEEDRDINAGWEWDEDDSDKRVKRAEDDRWKLDEPEEEDRDINAGWEWGEDDEDKRVKREPARDRYQFGHGGFGNVAYKPYGYRGRRAPDDDDDEEWERERERNNNNNGPMIGDHGRKDRVRRQPYYRGYGGWRGYGGYRGYGYGYRG